RVRDLYRRRDRAMWTRTAQSKHCSSTTMPNGTGRAPSAHSGEFPHTFVLARSSRDNVSFFLTVIATFAVILSGCNLPRDPEQTSSSVLAERKMVVGVVIDRPWSWVERGALRGVDIEI